MIDRRHAIAAGASLFVANACARHDDDYDKAVSRTWRHTRESPAAGDAVRRELVRYATLAPNGHNTQPWKFRLREGGIDIMADLARRTAVVDPDDHHLWVSLGCATENLLLAARAFGLAGSVEIAPDAVRVDLTPASVERSPLFIAIPSRQSTRGEYDGRPLAGAEIRQLEEAAAGDVHTAVLTAAPPLNRIRDLVIAGNTAQMADPAFVSELKEWIRFSKAEAVQRGDGLFSGSSGNPATPRWIGSTLFSLFFTADRENEKYTRQIRSSAGVAVIAADQAGPAGWVAAGRACERLLLQAAALDLRTAFLNQPVEVPALRTELAAVAGLGRVRPDLVVRFGRGPRLPASLRRPVGEVLTG